MALNIMQKIKPVGTFPAVDAEDVLMPDGTRLSEKTFTPGESTSQHAVLYTSQTLTEAQKLQARQNIDAASATDMENEIDRLDERISNIGAGGGSASVPVFDLSAMGMTAISMTGGDAALETDTTEILSALESGPVTFVIPVSDNGETMPIRCTMSGLGLGSDYLCTYILAMDTYLSLTVIVSAGYIFATLAPMEMGGTSDDHINALIDAKLGVIENGTY